MSFYSGGRLPNYPGPITCNPLNGLCEKACISAKKVFDICIKQIQESDILVTATDFDPVAPAQPLTFVSAVSVPDGAHIDNLTIDRLEDKPCFARIRGDVVIPIIITYTDANGITGTAHGNISIAEDVILYVPQPSIIPTAIEVTASLNTPDGEYVGNNVFSLDACISIIIKVVVEAEILVPTYGYCPIPACQDYTQDACSGFFDLPLFPAQTPVQFSGPTNPTSNLNA